MQNAAGQWQNLELSFTAQQNGYVQVYVANESDQEVYFDNLEVNHTPIIAQENHYYPFGMNMVGIEKQGLMQNMFQYNGQTERETSFNLHWDETPFRRYDAQLGRFHGVDALASKYAGITPYQYAFNNPVMLNDPSGLMPSTTDKMLYNFLGHDEPNSPDAHGQGGNIGQMYSKNQEEYYYYGKDGKYHNSRGEIASHEEAISYTIGRAISMESVFSIHPSSFGVVAEVYNALQESAGANAGGKEDKGGLKNEQEAEASRTLQNSDKGQPIIHLSGTVISLGDQAKKVLVVGGVFSRELKLTGKEFFDRAHWVYGEGGGYYPNYFAHAINNLKEHGWSGRVPFASEEALKKAAWKDNAHSYSANTVQTGNNIYKTFNNARKSKSGLNNLEKGKSVIRAVAASLLDISNDPTNGGYLWRGGAGKISPIQKYPSINNVKNPVTVIIKTKYSTRYTTFFQNLKEY